MSDKPALHDRIAAARKRIIEKYDAKTGSSSDATFGPLVEAILEVIHEDAGTPDRKTPIENYGREGA